ncbi:ATPase [Burkholderia sp. ABCPW 14]|uniref:BCAM0308 family protein n=1 Tax=Burkholderia sp. ABCPW 14 TaxID=1637860 RepID=UPI000770D7F3|nr:BCAM0308 family protein [Burkholderia sp. ABCPW 14]KVD72636.1 ATPase [Burkholderia sp. ABCPW 14]
MNHRTRPFKAGSHEEVYPGLAQDPCAMRRKLREPTVCPTCGAVFSAGRWQWLARPDDAHEHQCGACQRTAERLPAGYLHIDGPFANEHLSELLQLLRHHEERARAGRPMQRIMSIDTDGGATVVTTTDVHLARNLGSALKSAYQGSLDLKYSLDEQLVRAYWRR